MRVVIVVMWCWFLSCLVVFGYSSSRCFSADKVRRASPSAKPLFRTSTAGYITWIRRRWPPSVRTCHHSTMEVSPVSRSRWSPVHVSCCSRWNRYVELPREKPATLNAMYALIVFISVIVTELMLRAAWSSNLQTQTWASSWNSGNFKSCLEIYSMPWVLCRCPEILDHTCKWCISAPVSH